MIFICEFTGSLQHLGLFCQANRQIGFHFEKHLLLLVPKCSIEIVDTWLNMEVPWRCFLDLVSNLSNTSSQVFIWSFPKFQLIWPNLPNITASLNWKNNKMHQWHLSIKHGFGCLTSVIWPFTLYCLHFWLMLVLCKCYLFQGWMSSKLCFFYKGIIGSPT